MRALRRAAAAGAGRGYPAGAAGLEPRLLLQAGEPCHADLLWAVANAEEARS